MTTTDKNELVEAAKLRQKALTEHYPCKECDRLRNSSVDSSQNQCPEGRKLYVEHLIADARSHGVDNNDLVRVPSIASALKDKIITL